MNHSANHTNTTNSTMPMAIHIGLNPLYIYVPGLLLYVAVLLTDEAYRHVSGGFAATTRRYWNDTLLQESIYAWSDFVTDLSVVLNVRFPNLSLFVLMWAFLGVQVLPYMYIAFIFYTPWGFMKFDPPEALMNVGNAYAAFMVEAALQQTPVLATLASASFFNVLRSLLVVPSSQTSICHWLSSVARYTGAALWTIIVGFCGGLVFIACGLAIWLLICIVAFISGCFWVVCWIVLILIWGLLRIFLFVFGFLLFVSKILSFPNQPLTKAFLSLWTGVLQEREDATQDVDVFLQDARGRFVELADASSDSDVEREPQRTNQPCCCRCCRRSCRCCVRIFGLRCTCRHCCPPCCSCKNCACCCCDCSSTCFPGLSGSARTRVLHPSLHDLYFRGVNVFQLHFSYIVELVFESVAQAVIQIIIASMGEGSWNTIVSIVISVLSIGYYSCRYVYWLLLRPRLDGLTFREGLAKMHLNLYAPESLQSTAYLELLNIEDQRQESRATNEVSRPLVVTEG